MTPQRLLPEPGHVDEPQQGQDCAAVLSRVAASRQPVIVRRDGADLAAVIPMEYLEIVQDMLARSQAEKLAAQIDWTRLAKTSPPPQDWFDGEEPKPF
jgi:PHD/YefM family antitoxin component YafN of YafNO toxin-antitoxin module